MLLCSSAPASGNLPSSSALLICNPLVIAALTEKFIWTLLLVLILAWTFCHCFQVSWPAVDVCISLWLWQGEESVVLGNWGYIPAAVMCPVQCSTTGALVSRWCSCPSTPLFYCVSGHKTCFSWPLQLLQTKENESHTSYTVQVKV